ncbi:hypothetical protein MNL01_02570 [Bartonella krasnovii]|uniref:Holliday junction DNA helicase RuvB n=1 Tax=Bartonella krasnovii TaxID=2267275 RepID=A0A5B9D0B3_9HYPH|nr:hypothetical protein [Bartonella krasnovii]QEE11918.1 holliday junction DNA helicase RuvB [Bartonella krasnovii]UNF42729.1 hypothetical protein MNL08_02525 [Bartonella krasnovii]UNF52667.1 hypothetical protein MNL02_03075 [Bartonella krasnovii]UNF52735.1 hypothetical protein MNL02_03485 [Bartonella krasnovii]UNF54235.1 hypothetical protein MNL01_02570 [Bartonella krasnovii]
MKDTPTIYEYISFIISTISAGFVWYRYRKEQKEKCLGQKLQSCSVREVVGSLSPKNPSDLESELELTIYNPTNQIIKINHIKIPKKHPFIFTQALYPDPTEGISDSEKRKNATNIALKSEKYIDLIKPQLHPNHLGFFDLFSIKAKSKLALWLTIHPQEPHLTKPITIVVEHTSCNNPEKTLETTFCLGFFRWTDIQDRDFEYRIMKKTLGSSNNYNHILNSQ